MEKPSTARIALKWGIISALISVVSSIITYNTELWKSQGAALGLIVITLVAVFILAMKEFRSLNGSFMTYGEGLGLSMLLVAVSSLISSAFSIFYTHFIDTTFQEKLLDYQEENFIKQGLSDEQMSSMMEQMEKFSSPGIQFLVSIFTYLFIGFIIALIVSAFMKKNRPVFE